MAELSWLQKWQIDHRRSMRDRLMIHNAYDGKVFNVVLSDVPENKPAMRPARPQQAGGSGGEERSCERKLRAPSAER
jgi:hypothetical protein